VHHASGLNVLSCDEVPRFGALVLWSKAAKALSTTPSKGVAFAGYNSSSFAQLGSCN
jgi:hypothetical protein